MLASRARPWKLALCLLLAPRLARAAPQAPRYRLQFAAGQVNIYGKMQRLVLSHRVVIRVGRYRLTSQHLVLTREPTGIRVQGDGRLAFCPCPAPPVSIGFRSVLVAPPTDLLVSDPTLRVGSVPVLWLPYLWLRSPTRIGLLPPRVEWRGQDGLLLGSGVHLPLGGTRSAIDLRAGGYIKGGAQVEARGLTAHSSTLVLWDHLKRDLLAVDAHGSASSASGATGAWTVDALRGARGRSGTLSLERAARLYDRAEFSVLRADAGSVLAMGFRADALRGGALDRFGAFGPSVHLGGGAALGEVGTADAWVDVRTLSDRALGAASIAVARGRVVLDARPGPFALGSRLSERVDADTARSGGGAISVTVAHVRGSLPLVRAYGSRGAPLLHWVEPFAELDEGYAAVHADPFEAPFVLTTGELMSAVLGVRTALGNAAGRSAVALGVRGGVSGSARSPDAVAAVKLIGRARWFAISSSTAWLPKKLRALATSSRARVGREDGLHLAGYVEGRLGVAPTLARWLDSRALDVVSAGWFDRAGWTLGSALGVPWTSWMASTVSVDYDASARQLLGVRGTLGYRHPCGCLAAEAWAGHRFGRGGVDAGLTVDLLP